MWACLVSKSLANAIYNRNRAFAGANHENSLYIEDKLWFPEKRLLNSRHVVFYSPSFLWILSVLSRYYVTNTHTCFTRERTKYLKFRVPTALSFVMLIGQITQHHSKLNGWLITLKLRARCSLCIKSFGSIDFFSAGRFDWQA